MRYIDRIEISVRDPLLDELRQLCHGQVFGCHDRSQTLSENSFARARELHSISSSVL
jgi:hypothetical protein